MNGLLKILAGIAAALIGAKIINDVSKNTGSGSQGITGGTEGGIGDHDTGSRKR